MGCQVDHIISEKHRGPTTYENLAFACTFCNRNKGSDLATLDEAGQLVRLYQPRTDVWSDHFAFEGALIIAKSAIGAGTMRLLGFNDPARLQERRAMTVSLLPD